MALNVKQKYPGTQGGAAQLYASDTRLSLRRREQVFTPKSYKENMDISSSSSSTFILPCIFFVFLFLLGSVDATWRISSSSLSAPKLCFTVTSAAPDTWAKVPISLVGSFLTRRVKPKNEPEAFLNMTLLRVPFFASVCTLTLAPFV